MANNDPQEQEKPWQYQEDPDQKWVTTVSEWGWEADYRVPPIVSFTIRGICPYCGHPMDNIVTYGPRALPTAKPAQERAQLTEEVKPVPKPLPPAVQDVLVHAPEKVYVWCNCSVAHPPEASTNGCGSYGYIPLKNGLIKLQP